MIKKLLVLTLFFFMSSILCYSQSGMKFSELSKRLEQYFNKEMIADIQEQLPQGSEYTVWGWDVGDYSGDGNPDAAFTLRIAGEKGRTMQAYLFVDLDGYFVKVGQFPYQFVELPLEIGVVIRGNACFVTKKNKMYDWLIRGYRFDNGSLNHLDEFTTKRIGSQTYETYKNYENLTNTEKFINTRDNRTNFSANYTVIPSYPRGRLIYKGYTGEVNIDNVEYVPRGAFYWSGAEDLCYKVSSVYDNEYLYMTIRVRDDVIVPQNCDTCICDHVDVWFDITQSDSIRSRFSIMKGEEASVRDKAENGLFRFTIKPGNYIDKSAVVQISATDDLEAFQKIASRNVVAISDIQDSVYIIKFKIPFVFFGLEGNPSENGKFVEYGCTISVHDYDNEFRPEEYTEKTTSKFDPKVPASYGALVIVPDGRWYGESKNIYQEDIQKVLIEYGF